MFVICLRACKICVVFVERKPESNSHKLKKVLSPPQVAINVVECVFLM